MENTTIDSRSFLHKTALHIIPLSRLAQMHGFNDSPLLGRDAVIDFLYSRTHDKTTVHSLSTQYLDFEYHEDGSVAACIAKTYFTANTFTLPTPEAPNVNVVHTTQFGQYLDVLWPRDDEDNPGKIIWGIYHRRVKVMVCCLSAAVMVAARSMHAEWI
jgi:hypothetical protein